MKPFGVDGQAALGKAVREAAHAKDDLADIINVAIEELVRQAFELPGFTTIHDYIPPATVTTIARAPFFPSPR